MKNRLKNLVLRKNPMKLLGCNGYVKVRSSTPEEKDGFNGLLQGKTSMIGMKRC